MFSWQQSNVTIQHLHRIIEKRSEAKHDKSLLIRINNNKAQRYKSSFNNINKFRNSSNADSQCDN